MAANSLADQLARSCRQLGGQPDKPMDPLRAVCLDLINRHALQPFRTIAEIEPYLLEIRKIVAES